VRSRRLDDIVHSVLEYKAVIRSMAFRSRVHNPECSGYVSSLVNCARVRAGKNGSRRVEKQNIVREFSITASRLIGGKHYISYHYSPVVLRSVHTYVWPPVDINGAKRSSGQDEASNHARRCNVLSGDIAPKESAGDR